MTVMQHSLQLPSSCKSPEPKCPRLSGRLMKSKPALLSKDGSASFGSLHSGYYMQMNIVKLVFVSTPSMPTASLLFTGFGAVVGAAVRASKSLNKLDYHQTPET